MTTQSQEWFHTLVYYEPRKRAHTVRQLISQELNKASGISDRPDNCVKRRDAGGQISSLFLCTSQLRKKQKFSGMKVSAFGSMCSYPRAGQSKWWKLFSQRTGDHSTEMD